MTHRNMWARGGPKKPLQIIELSFEGSSQEQQIKQHVVNRGGRRYPLSLYSFSKDPEYEQEVHEEVERMIEDKFVQSHSSPPWAIESSKEITHSGEFPLFIHRLLSPSRNDNGYHHHITIERGFLRERRKPSPPKRPRTMYYRANRTHQYLTATELPDQSAVEVNLLHGRPTRTTLLRARQRCNSAPVGSFESPKKKEQRAESVKPNAYCMGSKENVIHFYRESGESMHSFLVGSRYNRAHLLDAKSLSYGIYMPRKNPTGCFMTGRTNVRSDEPPAAPPESPRSDIDEESTSVTKHRCPSSTRPTSGRSTPKSRLRSDWGDNTTTCNICQHNREVKENLDTSNTDQMTEEIISVPDGVKAARMLPHEEYKSGKSLPAVQGIAVSHAKQSYEVNEFMNSKLPPSAPASTRENTAELQITETNSSMAQDTQHKQQIDNVNDTSHVNMAAGDQHANVILEEKIEVKEIDRGQEKHTSTEQHGVVTTNNVDTKVKDGAVVNASETATKQTEDTFGKSVRLKASEVLTKEKDSGNEPDPESGVTEETSHKSDPRFVSKNLDQPSESDQEVLPTPVTGAKCDIKIFITEDGEDSKPYEHTST